VWSGFIWLKNVIMNLPITQKVRDVLSTTTISHLAIQNGQCKRYDQHKGTENVPIATATP